MTTLLIAGVAAVLPADFTTTLKRENPLFTKGGDYTYDVTLRMDSHTNRQLFGFVTRLNRRGQVSTGRTAVLLSGGRVYIQGREIITRWTEETVTLQIVAGNSELNFIAGQDRLISSLDMGSMPKGEWIEEWGEKNDYNALRPKWTAAPAVFPAIRLSDDVVGNVSDALTVPCPMLCPYLEKMMTALGYELTEADNALRETMFKDLFLVSGHASYDYADMLPGWTVGELLTEVENLTGAAIMVDNTRRRASIVMRSTFYTEARQLTLRDVADAYEAEQIDVNSQDPDRSTATLSYDMPSSAQRNLMRLPEGVAASTPVREYDGMPTLPSLNGVILGENYTDIMLDTSTGRRYIMGRRDVTEYYTRRSGLFKMKKKTYAETATTHYLLEVDQFADLKRGADAPLLELAITPAPMSFEAGVDGQEIIDLSESAVAVKEDSSTEGGDDDPVTLEEVFKNASEATSAQKTTLYAAFATDFSLLVNTGGSSWSLCTLAYTDGGHFGRLSQIYLEGSYKPEKIVDAEKLDVDPTRSLRLADIEAEVASGAYEIDTSRHVVFTTFDPNFIDTRQVYVVRGRRYVVREVEETIDAVGRQPLWRLTCHPLTVSDATLESRWVLSRGVWDDGAAWLDDGRWLDGN